MGHKVQRGLIAFPASHSVGAGNGIFPLSCFLTSYPGNDCKLSCSLRPRSSIGHWETSSQGRSWPCGIPTPWRSGSTYPSLLLQRTTRKVPQLGASRASAGGRESSPPPPLVFGGGGATLDLKGLFLTLCKTEFILPVGMGRGDVTTTAFKSTVNANRP